MADGDDVPRSDWIVAICSVLFDLDVGQRVDSTFPEDALTEDESNDVAFHSFPDSMSLELHSKSSVKDSTFFFRIRRRSCELPPDGKPPLSLLHVASDGSLPRSHYTECKSPFLYGFVFCRQRQDERLRRGGEQKSVVVLSMYPYSSVLGPLSQWAGPTYFNYGHDSLKEAFTYVSSWSPPEAGEPANLSIGELAIMTHLPAATALPPPAPPEHMDATKQHPDHPSSISTTPMHHAQRFMASGPGVFHEVDIFTPLKAILPKAWTLWELLLLAEPLMVVAPSPGEASAAVAALVSLITPMPYSVDFRPFFTIHDADFGSLAAGLIPSCSNALPRLLGVTNLYFLKALPAWPNVMSTGTRQSLQRHDSSGSSNGGSRIGAAVRAARRRAAGPQCLLTEHCESLWLANYRPLTRPATQLLRRLAVSTEGDPPDKISRAAVANSTILRAHFTELTSAFMHPFLPFLTPSLPPNGAAPLAAHIAPTAPPFSHASFLESLQASKLPAALTDRFGSQSGCINFYRRFLEGPNFSSWFRRRRQAAMTCQEEAWAEAISQRGIGHDESSNPHQEEVDSVGTFFEVEQCLNQKAALLSDSSSPSERAAAAVKELERKLVHVFEAMPRDLQQLVLSSPQRSALLQRLRAQSRVAIPGGAVRPQSDGRRSIDGAQPSGGRAPRRSLNGR